MAFIVKKKINGKEYYYLNENKRVEGKVKTKTIAYLGKTKEEAEKKLKEINKSSKNLSKIEKKEIKTKEELKQMTKLSIEEMGVFCKRKGFVYPSGEIYGGLAGFWDFGHLGVELKNNIKKTWWQYHVYQRDDIVGIDGSIITNPEIWKASGHVDSFVDVAVVCKKCGNKSKMDKFELEKKEGCTKCEKCGGNFESKGEFNPMFTTTVGPIKEDSVKAYLRPETAQLIFSNFKNVYEHARMKLPSGIAQLGKAFRNEIAPRNFLFRSREFEQMEIEYFIGEEDLCPYDIPDVELSVYSSEAQEKNEGEVKMNVRFALKKGIIKKAWHAYWLATEFLWFKNLGVNPDNLRIRQHKKNELAHYSSDCWDLEYNFPFGWKELEGIADRSDYDLSQHEKFSKKDLKIFDEKTNKKILPRVICEPSLGVERAFLVFMFDSYYYDKERNNIVLKLHPKLAPIKAAVFPIIKKENFEKIAKEIVDDLRREWNIIYDKSGSIGRRYARNDEIGTPLCITIDEETIKNKTVTVRWRDNAKQVRIQIKNLKDVIRKVIEGENILNLGKLVDTRKKI